MNDNILKNTNKKNLIQLIKLRFVAIFGQIITIIFVNYFLKISLPLQELYLVIFGLFLANLVSLYRYKNAKEISNFGLFFELIIDVIALTLQLYLTGGTSNPFISLFLLQVIISSILLDKIYAWCISFVTILTYVFLHFYNQPLHALHNHNQSEDFLDLHLHGMLISYIISALLLLIVIGKINKNLRERDEQINLLKRKTLEKEQMVKIAMFSISAAHELSTPLSTISIITNDWKESDHDEQFNKEIMVVKQEIERCKKILSEILSESKIPRLENLKK